MDRRQTWIALIIGSVIYLYTDRLIGDGSHTWQNVADAAYWGGLALFAHWVSNRVNLVTTPTKQANKEI